MLRTDLVDIRTYPAPVRGIISTRNLGLLDVLVFEILATDFEFSDPSKNHRKRRHRARGIVDKIAVTKTVKTSL